MDKAHAVKFLSLVKNETIPIDDAAIFLERAFNRFFNVGWEASEKAARLAKLSARADKPK